MSFLALTKAFKHYRFPYTNKCNMKHNNIKILISGIYRFFFKSTITYVFSMACHTLDRMLDLCHFFCINFQFYRRIFYLCCITIIWDFKFSICIVVFSFLLYNFSFSLWSKFTMHCVSEIKIFPHDHWLNYCRFKDYF